MPENTSLIDLFTEGVGELSSMPTFVVRGVGYWLASSLLGEYMTFDLLQRPIKPNIYVVISTKPGLGRSALLNIADDVMYRVYGSDLYGKRYHAYGTKEGLIDGVMDCKENYVHVILREFGVILDEMKRKDWMAGLGGLLSALYYGETWKEEYSKRRGGCVRFIRGVYATMIGEMQETELFLDNSFVKQGLMRRIIFLKPDGGDFELDKLKPLISHEYRQGVRKREGLVEELAKMFSERRDYLRSNLTRDVLVIMLPEVTEKINQIDLEYRRKAIEYYESDEPESYLAAEAEKLVKLTLIEALADVNNKVVTLSDGTTVFNVNPRHLERAHEFFEDVKQRIIEIYDSALTPIKPVQYVPSTLKVKERIKRIVMKKGGVLSLGRLESLSRLDAGSLKRYLLELHADGAIRVVARREFGLKPTYFIVLPGHLYQFLEERRKAGDDVEVIDDLEELKREWS